MAYGNLTREELHILRDLTEPHIPEGWRLSVAGDWDRMRRYIHLWRPGGDRYPEWYAGYPEPGGSRMVGAKMPSVVFKNASQLYDVPDTRYLDAEGLARVLIEQLADPIGNADRLYNVEKVARCRREYRSTRAAAVAAHGERSDMELATIVAATGDPHDVHAGVVLTLGAPTYAAVRYAALKAKYEIEPSEDVRMELAERFWAMPVDERAEVRFPRAASNH